MKFFVTIGLLWVSLAGVAQQWDATQQTIVKLIETAYAEGLQKEGDTTKIDAGFHPNFQMLYKGEGQALNSFPLSQWRAKQIERKANGELPRPAENSVSLTFEFIDVTDDVAVAKVNYFEGGTKTYIDYISLYKYGEEWKIISKIFYKL